MKKMTKVLALLLAMVMVMGLAACGSSDNSASGSASGSAASSDAQASADADSDLAYVQDKGTMVVGITDFAPMDYKDDDGEWTGFDAELARLVGEKLGVEIEFIEIDWDNKALELDSKSIDAVWNGMTLTDEVLNSMECSAPYALNAQVVVVGADVAATVGESADVADLSELSFAVETGSAGEEALTANGLDGNYIGVAAQSDALLEVQSGSSDACIIDLTMANAMTGEGTSYPDLKAVAELEREEYGIGFRKGSDMAAAIDAILDELRADGTLQDLADKYELTLAD